MITLTKIDLYVKNQGSFLANATLEFNNCFVISNVKLIETHRKHYHLEFPKQEVLVSCLKCKKSITCLSKYCSNCGEKYTMPNINKTHRFVCFPIDSAFREYLETQVAKEYENVSKRRNQDCRLVS